MASLIPPLDLDIRDEDMLGLPNHSGKELCLDLDRPQTRL
jgi:hypothetical protein